MNRMPALEGFRRVAVVVAVLLMATQAFAQRNSNAASVALNASVAETLTVSLNNNIVNFTPVPGQTANPGDATVDVTTTWILKPGRTEVKLYAYFSDAAAAMVHQDPANTVDIPSSAVEVQVGGGALNPVSNTVVFGAANAGLELFSEAITGVNKNANRTDTLSFNLNLGSLGQLPADDYVGTLTIQAQATP